MSLNFRSILEKAKNQQQLVLVIGLGRSGFDAAFSLHKLGLQVHVLEGKKEQDFSSFGRGADYIEQLRELDIPVSFATSSVPKGVSLHKVALAVVSPGVPFDSCLIQDFQRADIPVTNELELGLVLRGVPYLLVTGSNGKSTTASLISHFLQSSGIKNLLCGNIGVPVMRGLAELDGVLQGETSSDYTFLVVEASSYQIESSTRLKPKIGVFLNISENHLERHKNLEYYFYLKSQAFLHQSEEDFALLNVDDSKVVGLRHELKSKILGFGKSSNSLCGELPGTYFDYRPRDGVDSVSLYFPEYEGERFTLHESKLLGEHNRWNLASAILAARLVGASQEDIQQAIASFQPLEHRIEFVPSNGGPTFINDSKATTPISAYSAVKSICEKHADSKVHVMLGGQLKASEAGIESSREWISLQKFLRKKGSPVASIIFFGRDGQAVQKIFDEVPLPSSVCQSLEEAVEKARSLAEKDDLILFSPGCASFDEFTDFEQRGNVFKSLVGRR